MKTSRLAALMLLLAGPVVADQVGPMGQSDLNQDGSAERFYLLDTGDGAVDLLVAGTAGQAVYAPRIAWIGGIGQQPELTLAPNGSVRLTSQNEAIGRNRWSETLTIAYRSDAYRVAGLTYRWRDTLELDDNGVCDLNFLSGRGVLTRNGVSQEVTTERSALPVSSWHDELALPAACGFGG